MADGRLEKIGQTHASLRSERVKIERFIRAAKSEMIERWPPGLIKRWPGYGIERFLRAPDDLTNILAGSEGTLAAIFSAELMVSPLPREKGLGLIFFASVGEAMQATVELLDLKPAAIEHIDRPLFDQTKGQLHFQAARDLLELDTKPCESVLIVDHETSRAGGKLLRARRERVAPCPSGARSTWRVRHEKISAGCRSNLRAGAAIQRFALRRARGRHRAHRIHARPTRRRTA